MTSKGHAHLGKQYEVIVIRTKSDGLYREVIILSKMEALYWSREVNPYNVKSIELLRFGESLGVWVKEGAKHGVEAFFIALLGGTTNEFNLKAAKFPSQYK